MAKKASMKRKNSRKKAVAKKAAVKRIRGMSDKPREWPTKAAEARDRSAEEAAVIVREAEAGLEQTSDPNILKRLGRILAS